MGQENWIKDADIGKADAEMLLRLHGRVELVAEQAHGVDTFNTADGRVWYPTCNCEVCVATAERLDVAQAELMLGFKSVAITRGIEDSHVSPAWRRVAGWFNQYVREGDRRARAKALASAGARADAN